MKEQEVKEWRKLSKWPEGEREEKERIELEEKKKRREEERAERAERLEREREERARLFEEKEKIKKTLLFDISMESIMFISIHQAAGDYFLGIHTTSRIICFHLKNKA